MGLQPGDLAFRLVDLAQLLYGAAIVAQDFSAPVAQAREVSAGFRELADGQPARTKIRLGT